MKGEGEGGRERGTEKGGRKGWEKKKGVEGRKEIFTKLTLMMHILIPPVGPAQLIRVLVPEPLGRDGDVGHTGGLVGRVAPQVLAGSGRDRVVALRREQR